jgi:late competence protein required for DNA uptake (superfamily II DNA/RNA helicase)
MYKQKISCGRCGFEHDSESKFRTIEDDVYCIDCYKDIIEERDAANMSHLLNY